MSEREEERENATTKNKKLKKERFIGEAKRGIISGLLDKIKEVLEDKEENKNSTDGLEDTIKEIFELILEEFESLIHENENKKSFIGSLIQIFTNFKNKNYKNKL